MLYNSASSGRCGGMFVSVQLLVRSADRRW